SALVAARALGQRIERGVWDIDDHVVQRDIALGIVDGAAHGGGGAARAGDLLALEVLAARVPGAGAPEEIAAGAHVGAVARRGAAAAGEPAAGPAGEEDGAHSERDASEEEPTDSKRHRRAPCCFADEALFTP